MQPAEIKSVSVRIVPILGPGCQRGERLLLLAIAPSLLYRSPMSVSAAQLEAAGLAIARALCTGGSAPVKGPEATVAAVVTAALQENFRLEAAIDREVDKQIEKLGSSARGLDQTKLRAGLRERIAKQKGFAL